MSNSIIQTHQNEVKNIQQDEIIQVKPPTMIKKIGSTTYEISLYYSDKSRETMTDKILRLIKGEVVGKAAAV